ncbi:hypothetical protein DW806_09745 [Butyricicoccus sp. AM32-19]|nr:hypothetical protein DWZ82_08415 [Butyricicoccus sp. AF35-5AC]RHT26587.1 hypothetical protein DW806_09745 [Butyricicoccus sp. AM32-19]RHU18292.1 hypothetical protein DXD89_09010 [Butyricicoccus sp. TM10-16AC]RHV83954.1 hypothetical protein DXB00_05265 [Butyricicoccus sp. OF10-2]
MCYNKINHGQCCIAQSKRKKDIPMPYIAVTTSKALSDEQKDELKKTIGQKISLIPGKTEAALMVDISDNHTMYFAGEKRKLAYVDVRCYGSTEFENKKALTEALFDAVELHTGLHDDSIYLTYSEFSNWGTRGTMK